MAGRLYIKNTRRLKDVKDNQTTGRKREQHKQIKGTFFSAYSYNAVFISLSIFREESRRGKRNNTGSRRRKNNIQYNAVI